MERSVRIKSVTNAACWKLFDRSWRMKADFKILTCVISSDWQQISTAWSVLEVRNQPSVSWKFKPFQTFVTITTNLTYLITADSLEKGLNNVFICPNVKLSVTHDIKFNQLLFYKLTWYISVLSRPTYQ